MTRTDSIGLDRRIDIEWLDVVASQVASESDNHEVRSAMFELLEGKVSGGTRRGSACYKTVVVLSKTWINVAPEVISMRERAIAILTTLSPRERVALHWGMLMAGYSFFCDLSENVGRLIALQGDFSLVQITRRMCETWGDRSTMTRATQRVIRSMVQWGVLVDTEKKGVYVKAPKPIAVADEVAKLLIEGLLIQQSKAIPVSQAIAHPTFYPFDLSCRVNTLRQDSRFEVHRQGLDIDVVGLAFSKDLA
jgi:hypothetical protein